MISDLSKQRVQEIWQKYIADGEQFFNANEEISAQELDLRRHETIPEVMDWFQRFLTNEVPLEEFKTAIDGINKRNPYWGFKGINGQMFFNMLTKNSLAGNCLDELTSTLKKVLPAPNSPSNMKERIDQLAIFTRDVGKYSQDMRAAPKVGAIPFFISYFWQIQDPDTVPVYYTSMVRSLTELDIWSPLGEVAEDYLAFYHLNHEMVQMLSSSADRQLHLWDVEHAFWFYYQSASQTEIESVPDEKIPPSISKAQIDEFPDSYIPPIVSILPHLALNDEHLITLAQKSGKSVEKLFEDRIAILFRMLGYNVEPLGQGYGRVPDGVAVCREFGYAIIYDAKVRRNSYTMGTDERAIREYINSTANKLKGQGIHNIYFMVVSSSYSGDHDDVIRGLKIETNVREILLVESNALLILLEEKLRNPDFDLGPNGIQRLLVSSGILSTADVREFLS